MLSLNYSECIIGGNVIFVPFSVACNLEYFIFKFFNIIVPIYISYNKTRFRLVCHVICAFLNLCCLLY